MEDRNYFLQILLFAGVCIIFAASVWFGIHTLEDYREEYDTMASERDNFEGIMENLRAKNRTLQAINKVNLSNIKMINKGNENEFYTEVRRLIDENKVNMISIRNDEASILKLNLKGDYYALIHLFADWREMPYASRVTELKIKRDNLLPSDFVEAELTLEAWIAQ